MMSLARRLPQTWQDFARFLRAPALGAPLGLRAGWRIWMAMLALHLLGLGLLLVVLPAWQALTGIDGPAAFEQFPKQWLVPVAVLAAPVIEETLFRGWLSGRPRALWLLGCVVLAAAALVLVKTEPLRLAIGLLAGLVMAFGGWIALRKRVAPGWFARHFAAIFYAAAVLFGLVHVFNYASPGWLTLPMVLPQLWAGLMLGFVRTRVGLPASMLLHGAANGSALMLVALGG